MPAGAALTPREVECLGWLAKGLRSDGIAERLGVARITVDTHLSNARRKLGARTREQTLVLAIRNGLIDP
ncbi:helix-turn-helix domain-containing protein [Roseospirillum parvum]|uniref:helix-turn-helix domain-containing protein n=1 Tax=Roseospirillum parvum TaxID=83401 RepID=UPI0015A4C639|nr:helix-turn-helix transcriptional regulator [Roseospirillum parvum]